MPRPDVNTRDQETPGPAIADLDSPKHIDEFIDRFYARVLVDPLLAPVFLDVAKIDIAVHLPHIKAYWRKMLLGDRSYQRHMMRRHRELDGRQPLTAAHYQRWLELFESSLQKHYAGPFSERALGLARRVAGNMRQNIESFRANS